MRAPDWKMQACFSNADGALAVEYFPQTPEVLESCL